jgi:hypothetical protein
MLSLAVLGWPHVRYRRTARHLATNQPVASASAPATATLATTAALTGLLGLVLILTPAGS